MRHPRRIPLLAGLPAALLATVFGAWLGIWLGSCAPREEEAKGAWERFDPTRETPVIDITPFANPRKQAYGQGIGYLGAWEVRNLALVPPETFATYPNQSAGQVRQLRQVAGSRLAWRLTLGAEPFLTFVPLPDLELPCAATFRVGIRTPTAAAELGQVRLDPITFEGIHLGEIPLAPPSPLAPPAERVDLGDWAGQEVELLFHVDSPEEGRPGEVRPGEVRPGERAGAGGRAPGSCWVRWASPSVWSRGAVPPAPSPATRPNLILLGLDTLRADHVGAFRGKAELPWSPPTLTPALDRLAADSDVYLGTHSTANATNPSFASIFTGLYGKNHGVYDLHTPLPPEHTTLAEVLKEAGYRTLAVISAHHLGDHNSGLGQGFDEVFLVPEHGAAELAVDVAADWIAHQQGPFFVWLHLFDPHTPHTPPEPFGVGLRPAVPVGLGREVGWIPFRPPGSVVYDQPVLAGHRDLYAGEVAYLDHQVDRFLDILDSRRLLATSVVAAVGDHGEELGEHGLLYRHIGLWDTTTHVPMLIRRPGPWPRGGPLRGRRFTGLVQTIDLFPTLLHQLGLTPPPSDGMDLAELMGADGEGGRRAVFSEHAGQLGLTVRTPQYRLYKSVGNPHVPDGPQLFDLTADPEERDNRAGRGLAAEAQLEEILRRWLAERREAPETRTRELSPEEIRKLKALGYL